MYVRRLNIILALMILTLLYQNCGSEFRANGQDSILSSLSCGTPSVGLFKSTFYPFTSTTCVACHTGAGPGQGAFASSDVNVALNAFNLIGAKKIASYATNAGHAAPYTGPQNNAAVTPILTTWNAATACNTSGNATQIATVAKQMKLTTMAPFGLASAQIMTWDLSKEVLGVNMTGTLQIKIFVEQHALTPETANYNYFFLNPQIIGNTSNIHVKSMHVYVNGLLADTVTAYNSVDVVVANANTKNVISPIGQQFAVMILPTDTLSLYFDVLAETTDTPNAPLPNVP